MEGFTTAVLGLSAALTASGLTASILPFVFGLMVAVTALSVVGATVP